MDKRKFIALLAGGRKNVISLPFTDNFTYSDGLLPAPWKHSGSWNVLSGMVYNTPSVGADLVVNGNMETGSPPSNWTAGSSALSSVADERTGGAGSKSILVKNSGAAFGRAEQTLSAPAGSWLLVDGWAKRKTSSNAQILLQTSANSSLAYALSIAADTWANLVFSSWTSGANCKIVLADSNTLNGEHAYDDVSAKIYVFPSLYAIVKAGTSDITAKVTVTENPAGKSAGLIVNMDNGDTPLNYVVAYLSAAQVGAIQCRLDKCVNGVFSNVIAGNVTYGATKYIKVVVSGSDYSLYYGTTDVQVGTTQTIAGMSGKHHGIFATAPSKFDNFSLEVTPP